MTSIKVSTILVGIDGSKESTDAANYAMSIVKIGWVRTWLEGKNFS